MPPTARFGMSSDLSRQVSHVIRDLGMSRVTRYRRITALPHPQPTSHHPTGHLAPTIAQGLLDRDLDVMSHGTYERDR